MYIREEAVRIPLIDVIWPAKSLSRNILLVVGTSVLLALSAQIAVPLPFSPVPVTFQTLVALLAGAVLGSRLGALSVMVYLLEGLVGLPFFAKGAAGIAYFQGVTGGYLMGFLIAAFVVGFLVETGAGRKMSTAIFAMGIGNVVIYMFGITWLQIVLNISTSKAFVLGLYPFILGDMYKLGLGAILLPLAWIFFGKSQN